MASQTSSTSRAFRKSSNRLINTTLRGNKIADKEIQDKLESLSLKEQKSLRRISDTSWEVRHELERQLKECNLSLSLDCSHGNDSQFKDDVTIRNKVQKENKTICDRSSCSSKIDNHMDLVSQGSVKEIGMHKNSKRRRVGLQHCSAIQHGSATNLDTLWSDEAINCCAHPGLSSTPPPIRSTELNSLTKENARSEDSKRFASFSKLKFQSGATSSLMKDAHKNDELPLRHLLRQQLNASPKCSPTVSPVGSPSFSRKPQISIDVANLKESLSFHRTAEKQQTLRSFSGRTARPFHCSSPRLRQETISQADYHQRHNLYHSRSKSTPVAMNVTDLKVVSPKQEVVSESSLPQRQSPLLLRRRIESTDELQRKVKAFVNSLPVEK